MKARESTTPADPAVIGLAALAWTVGGDRAERLLDTTGLTPADLRGRADEPAVLAAVLRFLEAHEPDLLACAEAIDQTPVELVAARVELER